MTAIDGPRLAARSGKARQLVVFLHGYGADGNDLIDIGRAWQDVLPDAAIFVINIGVWVLNLISFALAAHVGIGWGLIGVYLMVINSVAHIVQAVRLRAYNPGLVTSILLFLPVGLGGLWAIVATGEASGLQQLFGVALSLVVHAGIVAYVLSNRRQLGGTRAA